MILNFKKNKIILFILFGLICLGVFWLMSNNKIKEGDQTLEAARTASASMTPQEYSPTAEGALLKGEIEKVVADSNLPFEKLDNLSEEDLNSMLNGLSELENSINEGTWSKTNLISAVSASGPVVDTTEPTCNNTFFTGATAEDGFCNSIDTMPERNRKCNTLTLENCNTTDCCIVLNGNKCVAGDAMGPIFKTENGQDLDYTFYAYKSECYGSCGNGVQQSANPCSAFQDNDTNVSKACLQRLWANTECPNTNFIDDAQVELYKDYTKTALKTKFKYDKNEENYAKCYGANESSWPAPCANTTDTSFGLSKRCLMKLFNDTGCPYTDTVNDLFVSSRSVDPKSAIIKEMIDMKNGKNDASYLKCYGPDKSKWPDPCVGVPENANVYLDTLPIQCAKKIYLDNMKDVGCTSAEIVDVWYKDLRRGTTQEKERFAAENAGKAPKDILYSKAWFDTLLKNPDFKNSLKQNKVSCYGINPNKWSGVAPIVPDPCSTMKYETLVDAVDPTCLRRLADALPSEKCSSENKGGSTAAYFVNGNLQWGDAYKTTLRNAFDQGKIDYLINPKKRDMKIGDVFNSIANFYTKNCTL